MGFLDSLLGRPSDSQKLDEILGLCQNLNDQLPRIVNRLADLETTMAWSKQDIARINASTSRIASLFSSVLAERDALKRGEAIEEQVSTEQANAVIAQLDAIGRDGANPVPEPSSEGEVPITPGDDVPPVVNVPDELPETPDAPAPSPDPVATSPEPTGEVPVSPEPVPAGESPDATPPASAPPGGVVPDTTGPAATDPASPAAETPGEAVFEAPSDAPEGAPSGTDPAPGSLGDGQTNV